MQELFVVFDRFRVQRYEKREECQNYLTCFFLWKYCFQEIYAISNS